MKDRIEIRFTVATDVIEGKTAKAIVKSLTPIGKIIESKLDRIAESLIKAFEVYVDSVINEEDIKEKDENYEN